MVFFFQNRLFVIQGHWGSDAEGSFLGKREENHYRVVAGNPTSRLTIWLNQLYIFFFIFCQFVFYSLICLFQLILHFLLHRIITLLSSVTQFILATSFK